VLVGVSVSSCEGEVEGEGVSVAEGEVVELNVGKSGERVEDGVREGLEDALPPISPPPWGAAGDPVGKSRDALWVRVGLRAVAVGACWVAVDEVEWERV